MAITATGCKARATVRASDADPLRQRIVELERQVNSLQRQNAELEAKLTQSIDEQTADVLQATPQLAGIAIERLSHLRERPGDEPSLLVYIRPSDGLGRFVQMVGTVSINAAVLPRDQDAFSIGRAVLGPLEVRDAYRASLMGAHYTFQVPLDLEAAVGHPQCIVQAEFVDGRTGHQYVADMAVSLELKP